MITLENVTRKYGAFTAVDGLSMSVPKGQVLGFLGPNGAGKSTTMRMISGFLSPTSGRISVCGFDVVENPVAVKKRIGYMPEGAPSYADMFPSGFLEFVAEARGLSGQAKKRALDRVIDEVSLENVLYQPIDTLSKGYKRRVGLAQALIHDPEVLILDEPTEGLDPNQKREIRSLLRRIRENKSIIISTHVLEEVEALCSRIVVIDKGKIVLDDTPAALMALSPVHQALYVVVPDFQKERALAAFAEFPALTAKEVRQESQGNLLFAVTATTTESFAADLVDALRRRNVKIKDLYVEKGRLDEVFYAFTSPEKGVSLREG